MKPTAPMAKMVCSIGPNATLALLNIRAFGPPAAQHRPWFPPGDFVMPRPLLVLAGILVIPSAVLAQHPVAFEIRLLTVNANEGCAVADFDNDGKLDIAAGRNWYRNGDWLPRRSQLWRRE